MKKTLILFLHLLITQFAFGQSDSVRKSQNSQHGNLVAHLYALQQIQGQDSILHVDSSLNYKITIPIWWKIRETPHATVFGGTFPEIDGIENALLFKSFNKEEFTSLSDFENWVIKDYKIGDLPDWSNNHKLILKEENEEFQKIGKTYFVQLLRGGNIYHCAYIILETSNTYLWIDFTATKETFDINFKKLRALMNELEIIE